jgi:hypothetical protein
MNSENEVIISGIPLDVPSDNYEEFDQEIDPAKLGNKLVQHNTLKGTEREFQLYSDTHLLLNVKSKKKQQDYRVNLAWLAVQPKHNKVIIWKWLYSSLAAAALTCLFIFLAVQDILKLEYSAVAGTVSLTASLILGLIFIYKMQDEFIFTSNFGKIDLFLIENKKPSQQEFDSFFINLQQAIERAKKNIPVTDRLVGELQMCRHLRDEGIIDDDTYTMARTAIFKHKQYQV